jgi:hypothetical protein
VPLCHPLFSHGFVSRGCGYEERGGQRAQVRCGSSTVIKRNEVDPAPERAQRLSRNAVESV